jgi:heat shock protein HslJ
MRLRPTAVLAACMIVAMAACSDDADVMSGPGATPPGAGVASGQLDGRTFSGTEVVGHGLVDGTSVTLSFEGDRLSTNAGCNTSTGPYTLEGGVLRSDGQWATTLMGCEPELEAQDQWLAGFLADGADVALQGDDLTLTSVDGGEVSMTLSDGGADVAALVGTTWMLHSIIDGSAVSSLPSGVEQPTMRIGEDGMAELFLGCNRGAAAVGTTTTDEGDLLTFGPIRSTKMACGEDAMATEATVLAVLESDPVFTITADRGLTLTASDGTGLEFRPA